MTSKPGQIVVAANRSGRMESEHPVDVAVVALSGQLVASAGDPARRTYWRSAAKPFQAVPLVATGAADAFQMDDEMLALACASHSSEPKHLEVARSMLAASGCSEPDLACGPHPSISPERRDELLRARVELSGVFNNCSGKHAGMLAVAAHQGVETIGYANEGHPVQDQIFNVVTRATGLAASEIEIGRDGCTAACFFLSLEGMARAWMHLAHDDNAAMQRLRDSMWAHPFLVAGTGRACTEVMAAAPGRVLAKVGAEGLYCGAIHDDSHGVGFALKVHSGDGRMSPVALVKVLRELDRHFVFGLPLDAWHDIEHPVVVDTTAAEVGDFAARGALQFR